MLGFTFANKHSSVFGLFVKSDNRTISPSLRKNEFVIPGRHGTIDYGLNTYEKRYITMELNLIKNSMQDLRQQARDVAQWLSREGMLVFDDEPDKSYDAKVYEQIDIEQIATTGMSIVVFECQPFAESLEYRQVNISSVTDGVFEAELDVRGTSDSCCIISIKNNGDTEVNDIMLRRKGAI